MIVLFYLILSSCSWNLVNGLQHSLLAMQRHYSVQRSFFQWHLVCLVLCSTTAGDIHQHGRPRGPLSIQTNYRIYSFPNHILRLRHMQDPICRPPSKSAYAGEVVVCEGRDLCLSVPTELQRTAKKNCHPTAMRSAWAAPSSLARQIGPESVQPALCSGQRCCPCRRYDTVSRSVISWAPRNCDHTVSPK